jgi:ABC-2 type transport system ATP-binding protein
MAVKIQNLKKKYLLKEALKDVTLEFGTGKLIGLLGPNGSGKTTLMRIMAGLSKPTSGTIQFDSHEKGSILKEHVAYMPTETHLYDWMSIRENVDFFKTFFRDFNDHKAYDILSSLQLDPKQKIKTLSTGQKARVKLALTLSRVSSIYLIDEPLNGVDPISRDMILDLLAASVQEDKCIVISSHLISEFEPILDDVVFLKNGCIDLMGDAETLRNERNMSIHELYKEVYKNA